MRPSTAVGLIALLAVAACGREEQAGKTDAPAASSAASAPATPNGPVGQTYDPALEAAGYYRPVKALRIGDYRLDHIAIGAPSDFAAWEKGQRDGLFGPIMLVFDDVTSPRETNELGLQVHEIRVRVTPQAYRLDPGHIAFKGVDAKLGAVVFEGRFDRAAFAEAMKSGSSGDKAVVVGDLTVGHATLRGERFTYWAGD